MHTLAKHAGVALAAACIGSLAAPAPASTAEAAGAVVVSAVEQVCLRQIGGSGVQAASTGGANRDGWIQKLDGRGEVRVSPPSRANPKVCQASVSYAPGGQQAILAAIDAWAAAHNLQKTKTREPSKGADLQYWISSWTGTDGAATTAIVFTEQAELDGRPTGGALSEAVLLVSRQ